MVKSVRMRSKPIASHSRAGPPPHTDATSASRPREPGLPPPSPAGADGVAVRLFAPDDTAPNAMYQAANDGSGWTSWQILLSSSGATRQPAVTNVNGDVDLVSHWFNIAMQEPGNGDRTPVIGSYALPLSRHPRLAQFARTPTTRGAGGSAAAGRSRKALRLKPANRHSGSAELAARPRSGRCGCAIGDTSGSLGDFTATDRGSDPCEEVAVAIRHDAEPPPERIGVEVERLTDALERVQPAAIGTGEPVAQLALLPGQPAALIRVEVYRVLEDAEHQTMCARLPGSTPRPRAQLLGEHGHLHDASEGFYRMHHRHDVLCTDRAVRSRYNTAAAP